MNRAATRQPVDVTPSARRLTGSLRDIGYDFVAALADIVDNSVAAGADRGRHRDRVRRRRTPTC